MTIEYLDVQWTVICEGSEQAAFDAAKSQSESLGWTFMYETKPMTEGARPCAAPSSESTGEGCYVKDERSDKRTLFWSTFSNGTYTKITGGLYLYEYAGGSASAYSACDQALDDLRCLFAGPKTSCIVLALEDDEGIDSSPGIVGIYRTTVWRRIAETNHDGVIVMPAGDWVLVRPAIERGSLISVYSMPSPVQASLHAIQDDLDRMFWRRSE